MENCLFDVINVSESNFDTTIIDAEIQITGFDCLRKDRDLNIRTDKQSGGGLLIYCRSTLGHQPLVLPSSTYVEWMGATLHLHGIQVNFINIYAPPLPVPKHAILSELELLLDNISERGILTIITGDFNLPGIRWDTDPDIEGLLPGITPQTSPQEFEIIQLFFTKNFIQISPVKNSLGTHLDLIFASPNLLPTHLVLPSIHYLFKNSINHEPITATFQVTHSEKTVAKVTPSYFPQNTHAAILQSLSDVECDGNCVSSLTENLNNVNSTLKHALTILRADKKPSPTNPFPNWFKPSTNLLLLRTKVDNLRRSSKKLTSPSPQYLDARKEYSILKNREVRAAKQKVSELEENKDQFFKYTVC